MLKRLTKAFFNTLGCLLVALREADHLGSIIGFHQAGRRSVVT